MSTVHQYFGADYVKKNMEKRLPQWKPTNTHSWSEISYCYNTLNSTWFGPHWSIFRECTFAENNRLTFSSSPVCSRIVVISTMCELYYMDMCTVTGNACWFVCAQKEMDKTYCTSALNCRSVHLVCLGQPVPRDVSFQINKRRRQILWNVPHRNRTCSLLTGRYWNNVPCSCLFFSVNWNSINVENLLLEWKIEFCKK
jgi:hypothetical protein